MIIKKTRGQMRRVRHARTRLQVKGNGSRPRLAVYRSSRHIYAQVIDDTRGHTMVSACSLEPEVRRELQGKGYNLAAAAAVGARLAQKAVEKGIRQVVYDRGGYPYHGRVAALAQAARENGLEF